MPSYSVWYCSHCKQVCRKVAERKSHHNIVHYWCDLQFPACFTADPPASGSEGPSLENSSIPDANIIPIDTSSPTTTSAPTSATPTGTSAPANTSAPDSPQEPANPTTPTNNYEHNPQCGNGSSSESPAGLSAGVCQSEDGPIPEASNEGRA